MFLKLSLLSLIFLHLSPLVAAPSSLFWTNCTTDVLPYGQVDLNVQGFYSFAKKHPKQSVLPPSYGVEMGLLNYRNWHFEAGVDFLTTTNAPVFFNAKLGVSQDGLFQGAPSFSFGLCNVGTSKRTNYNVLNVVCGKKYGKFDNFYVGIYSGSRANGKNAQGVMLGYLKSGPDVTYQDGRVFHRWEAIVDFASGKTLEGGGSCSLVYYFRPELYIQMGPTFFNSAKLLGKWKCAFQLHYQFGMEH